MPLVRSRRSSGPELEEETEGEVGIARDWLLESTLEFDTHGHQHPQGRNLGHQDSVP